MSWVLTNLPLGTIRLRRSSTLVNKFIESLDTAQIVRVSYALKDPERREWTNLPPSPNAGGVRLGDLSVEQVKRLCDFMANLFSPQGYNKIRDIMLADDQLLKGSRGRARFGTENFSVVVFGQPAVDGAWAFQIDGHHVGINVALNGNQMTMAPSFIGTQPEAFTIAGKKYEPFAGETGDAYELVNTLSDEQIKQAVLQLTRGSILTGPGNDGKVPEAKGLACSTFYAGAEKTAVETGRQLGERFTAFPRGGEDEANRAGDRSVDVFLERDQAARQ